MEPITATLMANLFNSYVFLEAELLPREGWICLGPEMLCFSRYRSAENKRPLQSMTSKVLGPKQRRKGPWEW